MGSGCFREILSPPNFPFLPEKNNKTTKQPPQNHTLYGVVWSNIAAISQPAWARSRFGNVFTHRGPKSGQYKKSKPDSCPKCAKENQFWKSVEKENPGRLVSSLRNSRTHKKKTKQINKLKAIPWVSFVLNKQSTQMSHNSGPALSMGSVITFKKDKRTRFKLFYTDIWLQVYSSWIMER